MADKEIDFEELDRAIGALMEKQAAEEDVIEELSQDTSADSLDEIAADLVAKIEEDADIEALAKTGAISDLEIDEIDQETKERAVPDTSGIAVKVKQRVPVGFDMPVKPKEEVMVARPVKVPVPDDLLGKSVSIKPAEEESFSARVNILPKKSNTESGLPLKDEPVLPKIEPASPKIDLKPIPEPAAIEAPIPSKLEPEVAELAVKIPKKTHIPHRRGQYIDFVAPGSVKAAASKLLSAEDRRARAAKINSRQQQKAGQISDFASKPVKTTRSLDFEVKLPAKGQQPATTLKGNVQTDKTTVVRSSGETMTVKQQTVELVSQLEPEPVKPVVEQRSEELSKIETKPDPRPRSRPEANLADSTVAELESAKIKSNPFIPEARVKKRPLGQPEPLLQSPSVTMHVPDRISTYDAGEQAALYRAELRTVEDDEHKSSTGWVILLIVIILIVAGLVYFFWGDIQPLLR